MACDIAQCSAAVSGMNRLLPSVHRFAHRASACMVITRMSMQVIAQLRGDLPLPWEGNMSPAVLRQLGAFKGPVLQLLHRDASQRVSMKRFYFACTKIVASRTTVEA
jgi:hypothetical protein